MVHNTRDCLAPNPGHQITSTAPYHCAMGTSTPGSRKLSIEIRKVHLKERSEECVSV